MDNSTTCYSYEHPPMGRERTVEEHPQKTTHCTLTVTQPPALLNGGTDGDASWACRPVCIGEGDDTDCEWWRLPQPFRQSWGERLHRQQQ